MVHLECAARRARHTDIVTLIETRSSPDDLHGGGPGGGALVDVDPSLPVGQSGIGLRDVMERMLVPALESIEVDGLAGPDCVAQLELFAGARRIGNVEFPDATALTCGTGSQLDAECDDRDALSDCDLARAYGRLFGDMSEVFAGGRCVGLHPHWLFEADGWLFGRNQGSLLLALSPYDQPLAPANDSDADPYLNDIGVIAFPLWPWRVLDCLAVGYGRRDAIVAAFVLAVGEAWAHETFEMYQSAPGVPYFNAHDRESSVGAALTLAGGARFELSVRA